MPHLVNGPERFWVSNDDVKHLVEHGLIDPHEDNETGEEIPDEHVIESELRELFPKLTHPQLIELIRYHELIDKHGRGEKLSDWETLELLNFALSIPEWPVSLLEDIAEIVRRTGRKEIPGATWAAH